MQDNNNLFDDLASSNHMARGLYEQALGNAA